MNEVKIHIVKKGDTLWKIAQHYGVNFEELKNANQQLTNPDMLMPGMKIKIPSGAVHAKTKEGAMPKKEMPKEMPIQKPAEVDYNKIKAMIREMIREEMKHVKHDVVNQVKIDLDLIQSNQQVMVENVDHHMPPPKPYIPHKKPCPPKPCPPKPCGTPYHQPMQQAPAMHHTYGMQPSGMYGTPGGQPMPYGMNPSMGYGTPGPYRMSPDSSLDMNQGYTPYTPQVQKVNPDDIPKSGMKTVYDHYPNMYRTVEETKNQTEVETQESTSDSNAEENNE